MCRSSSPATARDTELKAATTARRWRPGAWSRAWSSQWAAGLLAAALLAQATPAWACASCSSGGDEPLVLYPNEAWKLYLGLARQGAYRYLQADGQVGWQDGPQHQDSLTLAVGRGLTRAIFVTVTAPMLRQTGAAGAAWGLGDLSLNARWTLLPQTFVAPWRPQLQLSSGYRLPTASLWSWRQADLGMAAAEARLGTDLWWGMHAWQAGSAAWLLLPHPYVTGQGRVQPGMGLRLLATVAYRVPLGRLGLGLVHERRGRLRAEGRLVAGSQVQQNALFATLEAQIGGGQAVRLMVSRSAVFLSRNARQSTAITLAWIGAWS